MRFGFRASRNGGNGAKHDTSALAKALEGLGMPACDPVDGGIVISPAAASWLAERLAGTKGHAESASIKDIYARYFAISSDEAFKSTASDEGTAARNVWETGGEGGLEHKKSHSHWRESAVFSERFTKWGERCRDFVKRHPRFNPRRRDYVIAEYGPGGGAVLDALAPYASRMYGFDISQTNLDETAKVLSARDIPFDGVVVPKNFSEIRAFPEEIDIFLSFNVFQHFPSKGYLREVVAYMARCMAPGAIGVVDIRFDNGDPKYTGSSLDEYQSVMGHTFATSIRIDHFWRMVQDAGLMVDFVGSLTSANGATFWLSKRGAPVRRSASGDRLEPTTAPPDISTTERRALQARDTIFDLVRDGDNQAASELYEKWRWLFERGHFKKHAYKNMDFRTYRWWGANEDDVKAIDKAVSEIQSPGLQSIFIGTNILTINKTAHFLFDKEFLQAVGALGSTVWNKHIFLTAALNSLNINGDLILCGKNTSVIVQTISKRLSHSNHNKKLYVLDLVEDLMQNSDSSCTKIDNLNIINTYNISNVQEFKKDKIVSVAFLYIDIGDPVVELDIIASIFPKLSRGGYILFEGYGHTGRQDQLEFINSYLNPKGYFVFELPTGQGLVVK